MSIFFDASERIWLELYPGVFASNFHRYEGGGGSAIFRVIAGASIPEHNHLTGEHGYIISGVANFGMQRLQAGDGFWVEPGEIHNVCAIEETTFVATSLPRGEIENGGGAEIMHETGE